jgi:hypothetical protein
LCVRTGDGDQSGVAGQAFQVQREFIQAQAIADAAEALQGEFERLHAKVFNMRVRSGCQPSGSSQVFLRRQVVPRFMSKSVLSADA